MSHLQKYWLYQKKISHYSTWIRLTKDNVIHTSMFLIKKEIYFYFSEEFNCSMTFSLTFKTYSLGYCVWQDMGTKCPMKMSKHVTKKNKQKNEGSPFTDWIKLPALNKINKHCIKNMSFYNRILVQSYWNYRHIVSKVTLGSFQAWVFEANYICRGQCQTVERI